MTNLSFYDIDVIFADSFIFIYLFTNIYKTYYDTQMKKKYKCNIITKENHLKLEYEYKYNNARKKVRVDNWVIEEVTQACDW